MQCDRRVTVHILGPALLDEDACGGELRYAVELRRGFIDGNSECRHPLKLVLIEGAEGEATRMDHLGVEVASTDEVTAATARLANAGLATRIEDNTTCCYAVQDKVWVTGPGREPWEVYTVTADARPDLEGRTGRELSEVGGDGSCCTSDPRPEPVSP